jgi:beta-galactosidase/beta-glucuronidase
MTATAKLLSCCFAGRQQRLLLLILWVLTVVDLRALTNPTVSPTLFSRPSISLSGPWEFRMDSADVGRFQKWFDPSVSFDQTIQVPGSWNTQGVEFRTEKELSGYEQSCSNENKYFVKLGILGAQRESEKMFHVFPGPAWYRKSVSLPDTWDGLVPWLVFGGVHREAEVWINGRYA